MRIGVDVDAAQTHLLGPLDLRHGEFHVPPGQQRHRENALAAIDLELGHRVVEDLHTGQPQLVIDLDGMLAAESEDIGIQHLGRNAHCIHHLDAFAHAVRGRMHFLELMIEELQSRPACAIALDRR